MTGWTFHVLESLTANRRRQLLDCAVYESDTPRQDEFSLAVVGPSLRIISGRDRERIAKARAQSLDQAVVRYYRIGRRNVPTGEKVVVSLHRRVDAEDGRADIPTRRRNVNGCAQYRTDLANVGIAAQHRGYRSDARYRRVSIERQRSLRCETDVEATRDQQLSK